MCHALQQTEACMASSFGHAGFYAFLIDDETSKVWVGGAVFQSSAAVKVCKVGWKNLCPAKLWASHCPLVG